MLLILGLNKETHGNTNYYASAVAKKILVVFVRESMATKFFQFHPKLHTLQIN